MDSDAKSDLRGALRRVIVAWLFGSAWMYLASGASFTRYAKLIRVTPFGFGVLAMIPFAGALVQLPASLLLERHGRRKTVFLWSLTLHRALWLVIAALPWLFPRAWQWPALLTVMTVSTLLANISTPAWMAWMSELIPGRVRGRYFSRRVQYGQAVGLVLSILSGMALDWPRPEQGDLLRNVISALFAVAGICGTIDALLFIRVPDTARTGGRPSLSLWDLVRPSLADGSFRRFLGYSFTITFATGFMGQFSWLYLLDVVGVSNVRANVLLVSAPLLVGMASYPFWGRFVDRFGSKTTLLIAGILVINGASSWVFVTRGTWIPGYICVLIATAAWGGMDIGAFNLLLRMTGGGGRRGSDTAVIAINSVVAAVAGTLSGLFGGSVAQALGDDWRLTVWGWTLTYHGVLFLCSTVLRAAAVAWIVTLKETRGAVAPRYALRYMATSVYSNLLQATFFPARAMLSLARVTWKVSLRRR